MRAPKLLKLGARLAPKSKNLIFTPVRPVDFDVVLAPGPMRMKCHYDYFAVCRVMSGTGMF